MICSNCGQTLDDSAKFCTKCGMTVGVDNRVAYASAQAQPTYNASVPQQMYYPNNSTNSKDKTIKIVGGIVIVVLLAVVAVLYSKVTSLESSVAQYERKIEEYEETIGEYKGTIGEYEETIGEYENRSTLDKTGEALEGWLEYFK